MPRADFLRDARQASHPQLTGFELRQDDTFSFTYSDPAGHQSCIQLLVPDLSAYPTQHEYLIWGDEAISDPVAQTIQSIGSKYNGRPLNALLQGFLDCLTGQSDDNTMDGSSEGEGYDFDTDGEMDLDTDHGPDWDEVHKRLQKDLQAAKHSGIKVGVLGDMQGRVIVVTSCRVARLNISNDALQLWNVSPSDYLVLLIKYPYKYYGLDDKSRFNPLQKPQMYVGLCDSYKPTLASTLKALHPSGQELKDSSGTNPNLTADPALGQLRSSFVTEMLTDLFNERLLDLIQLRIDHGYSWTGAEHYYDTQQGTKPGIEDVRDPKYFVEEAWSTWTPSFVQKDDLRCNGDEKRLSLPRIAMQYALRRFTRASEFCLVCYCKTAASFQALNPYVCSKRLCLFQYLECGKGPKLEWQIVHHPEVVDLLVSFAYRRAMAKSLTDCLDLPLKVPNPNLNSKQAVQARLVGGTLVPQGRLELKVGEWVVLTRKVRNQNKIITPIHYCVRMHNDDGSYTLSGPIYEGKDNAEPTKSGSPSVMVTLYNKDFDNLTLEEKQGMLVRLLDTLPGVASMVEFIKGSSSHRTLDTWKERISPAALYLLRWIVSSNRSCIIYDKDPAHKVAGMEGHMQFRLAQGTPDKEQEFVEAIEREVKASKKQYPTLFAWHGSPVSSWHSILRQGLHFEQCSNGRSFGDGVYLARDFRLSEGYSLRDRSDQGSWPSSKLGITMAISLNEVVNCPEQFKCTSPYVVQEISWIMPRYLFVKCSRPVAGTSSRHSLQDVYVQDPKRTALGQNDVPVTIPLSGVRTHLSQAQRTSVGGVGGGRELDTGYESDATLDEDRRLLEENDDDSDCVMLDPLAVKMLRVLRSANIKLLPPPTDATSQATTRLMRELGATAALQARGSLTELGWYIDPEQVDNPYQWLVALHSFDPSLPLARDLAATEDKCILLEIRFPPSFPYSPPFVRVVRPRFVPLAAGGGGHVTAGGAICMDLLTGSGWNPLYRMESVLLQVRLLMSSKDPYPARLDARQKHDYSWCEAVNAFIRMCSIHNWKVPEDFGKMQAA
ncbi:hypothetical protein ASPACDRAFT_61549 [Aspergillus aculeatus ATCC 16872]|uniref:UBC core domain-containing protein n=1 Tax=Aspergillus aculeatus (strain ATCC 16872 / CBS 172.66 / WB 5094) TaxID=690307 RepID=A0A1L9WSE9_ASPA1|nr:uncharacterized protein ASPACDRAFT_61549 [Aspergillus aculeatus ATCC 16872]OJJ98847.1 hypothetical protein ASPACDRAFT_61549 [Aspergillus aculeatus ATCC 16872]